MKKRSRLDWQKPPSKGKNAEKKTETKKLASVAHPDFVANSKELKAVQLALANVLENQYTLSHSYTEIKKC